MIALTSFISPYRARPRRGAGDLRARAISSRSTSRPPSRPASRRDPKGLYKKARAGQIPEFTGISAPYEAPERPELVLDTGALSVEESVATLLRYLEEKGYLSA